MVDTDTGAAAEAAAAAAAAEAAKGDAAAAEAANAEAAKAEAAKAEAAKAEAGKNTGAPETYEFKLPDGVHLPEEGVTAFGEFAKAQDMPQEAAQDLLGKLAPAMQQRQEAVLASAREEWTAQVKADKELGGDKLEENLAVAVKAREQFGSEELTTLLNETSLGNHPALVRFFFKVGKAISEDGHVTAGGASAEGKTPAQKMYPTMN